MSIIINLHTVLACKCIIELLAIAAAAVLDCRADKRSKQDLDVALR
jgi:hypothetical protein